MSDFIDAKHLPDIEKPDIDMSKFDAKFFYDFNYFKKKFPNFENDIIELLVTIANEKVVVDEVSKKTKTTENCVIIEQKNTILTFD